MATQTRHKSADTPVRLRTIRQAGERLECSSMHIYRLIASGALSAVDIAQPGAQRPKTRIREDDLDAYVESRTRRAGTASGDPRPAA